MKVIASLLNLPNITRHFAGVLTLSLAPLAVAGPDSVMVFGDSAADQGNLNATPGYAPGSHAPYYKGPDGLTRLSDGLMWTERLFPALHSINAPSGALGHSVNFAYGAATTGTSSFGAGEAGELPVGVQSQVAAYLALRSAGALPAPSNSTYAFIEAGPNDYFAALDAGAPLGPTAVASPARLADSASKLAAAGIHTIFVTETPDFGDAPLFADLGLTAGDKAALRDLAAASRANLRSELAKVQAKLGDNYHVVVLPLNSLFRAVQTNPAAFGFTNITGKTYDDTTDTLLERDPSKRDGYLFVDSLHLTARGQAWQARYYSEVISAIDGTQHRRFARLTDALRSDADLMRRLGDEGLSGPTTAQDWTFFASVRGATTAGSVEDAAGPGWRSNALATLVGARRLLSPNWTLGIGLGAFSEHGKLSPRTLSWENNAEGLWVLNQWKLDPVTVRLSGGVAHVDTDLTRDTSIPTFVARGDTGGVLSQARFEVERPLGRITHSIAAELTLGTSMSRSTTKAFNETGASGLNLEFERVARDSMRSDAGFRLRGDSFRIGRVAFEPSADFLFTYEAGDRSTDISTQLSDNPAASVRVAADNGPRAGGAVRFACGIVLTDRLRAEIADLVEVSSSGRHQHRVELGMNARF